MSLENQILQKIQTDPGQFAGDMVAENTALYRNLNGLVWQDKGYRWHPKDLRRQQ